MAEQGNRWSWEVGGFEPWKSWPPSFYEDDRIPIAPLTRTNSISHSELSKLSITSKLQQLTEKLKLAKEDYLQLRQEVSELQEYSNAKLDRVTRYLGVLASKSRKLDQVALETEARISPLINEKRRLFNDLLTSKGNVRVFCRSRPLFEDEGVSAVEIPDNYTIRVNTGDESLSLSKKDFEFDRVYGPQVGQAELFSDVEPLVQSALDGYNVSIFAYGQTHSGKTHTMEGSSYGRGLYARCFEELFDLANLDLTSTSRYEFSVTVFELYNEQTRDLLFKSGRSMPKLHLGSPEYFVELVTEKVNNPLEFSRVLKAAIQSRGNDLLKINVSHLIVTIHIFYNNLITCENSYSKLSLVDLAGSEGLITEDDSGERVTDLLHVMKSLSALGDVLSSLTSKKDVIPFENSVLTKLLADSLGGSSKTLMIVNICPHVSNLSETLSSLNFSARARNSVISLGNRHTIKKWRDIANDARKELYEKEKEIQDLKQENLGLKQSITDVNDQCVLLFNEVQKAWKVSSALQTDLKSEHIMLADKLKIEREQNAQLRNQVAQLLQFGQDKKSRIQQQDSTIQNLQGRIQTLETQLNEAVRFSENRSVSGPNSDSEALYNLKGTEYGVESSTVTKKLEEELKKRDALIEKLHEENEKLFDRLTEKTSLIGSPQSIPEDDSIQDLFHTPKPSADRGSGSETDVAQWNVLQFNTGNSSTFIIKCGANSNSELVIKADFRVQEPKGSEIVRVAPKPSILENMSLEEMKHVFAELPEALSLLALARTADETRARYSRLYRTLAMKVPSLKDLVSELDKGGVPKDVRI